MTEPSPFTLRGKVSMRAACVEIIRSLAEDEGITYAECVDRMSELTELDDLARADALAAMRSASEGLIAAGEPGVRNVRGYGWVRMTPQKLLQHADSRDDRGRRQFLRGGLAAQTADPERLTWQDRQRRDARINAARRVQELTGRRSRKLRPLPPAESA